MNDKLVDILQIIKNDKPLEDYFFKKLSISSNPQNYLKTLHEKEYFNPKNNPKPKEHSEFSGSYVIPYWRILDYLEKVSEINKKRPSAEITKIIIRIIDSLISHENKVNTRIENYHTDRSILKIISNLPTVKIKIKYIKFVKIALQNTFDDILISSEIEETLLPALIEKKSVKLIMQLMYIILEYKKPERKKSYGEYTSLMDNYWLNKALKKYKPDIAKICAKEAIELVLKRIKAIVKEDPSQFNLIWIPAIEDHSQTSFPDRYECQLVYFVRDMLESLSSEECLPIVQNMLTEKQAIFKRIAIHTINKKFKDLNYLLFEWNGNPLDEIELKHELYELLKTNSKFFIKDQLELIIKWIESIKFDKEENVEKQKKFEARHKKEWYMALLDSDNNRVKILFEKYTSISPYKIDHPGFDVWMGSSVGEKSPVDIQALMAKPINEIADYLNQFKQEKGWDKPTEEGLALMLEISVKDNHQKFAHQLEPFLKTKRKYQAAIIRGFVEVFKLKKECNWQSIFEFVKNILFQESIWQDKSNDERYNYRNWMIREIAELIHLGTQKDENAFDSSLFSTIEEILIILLNRSESEITESSDLVTSVLNSGKGEVYSALISYSLRWARLNRAKEQRWKKEILAEIEKRLDPEKETSPELWVTLGKYLSNIFWLDNEWANQNLNSIFPIKNEKVWQYTMTGYLFFANNIYEDIYILLRKHGHYSKAIKINFVDEKIGERVVGHICIAYITGWENISDKNSLISELLQNENPDQYKTICQFFWNQKVGIKLKPLWQKIHIVIMKKIADSEFQLVASKFSLLLGIVGEMDDDIYEWVNSYIPYLKLDFKLPFFVEALKKHVNKSPKKVGDLYLEMLNKNIFPDYNKDNIRIIVEDIYKNKLKDTADRICNLYGEKSLLFLRDIYEKNQNDKK